MPGPALVAVDPDAARCEHPSLLMTHLAGLTVLDDEGVGARVELLARQLVAIHAVRPAERPRGYVVLSTADTVVVPRGADAGAWAAAVEVIRAPAPGGEKRFLHRDFQPGNVLFDARSAKITGVVDWAGCAWGPVEAVREVSRPWREAGADDAGRGGAVRRLRHRAGGGTSGGVGRGAARGRTRAWLDPSTIRGHGDTCRVLGRGSAVRQRGVPPAGVLR
ncbi:phosphotransferase family protein [Umezawaea sp. NPDC059074]|uniref:phosphotransferase family protein n=1 Tax=Umezawaea sp. NPDC059074 TaxID=3346716 RepID=UPI0036766CF3